MSNEHPSAPELLRSGLQRTGDCPAPEELEKALAGCQADGIAGGADINASIAAHMQSCAYCGAEMELLRTFQQAQVRPEDARAVQAITERLQRQPAPWKTPAKAPRRAWWMPGGFRWAPAALAFAGALMVMGIGIEWQRGTRPALESGGSNGAEVFRSHALTIVSPTGDLAQAPDEVRWEAAPSAASYKVRLLEVDGNELWSAQTAGTVITFPAGIRALMAPAKTLICTVAAYDAPGRKIAESEAARFRVLQTIRPR